MGCSIFSSRKKEEDRFLRNGGKLLEELISFCDGKCNPIRSFSAEELKIATNNYNLQQLVADDDPFTMYKGLLQDCPVLVKKYYRADEGMFEDISFASVFSSHNNVLKLLGCCLETEYPILVFEYAANGTLEDRIFSDVQPLPWKCRLKIAMDLCNAVAYLHNVFPKPIIHRHIKPAYIFLDENNAVKLSNFFLSIAIPDGEFQIKEESFPGTWGCLAPEYMMTKCGDEKIDVFSVGVVLLQLLTGKRLHPNGIEEEVREYINMLDRLGADEILKEGTSPEKEQQLQDFASIASQCYSYDVNDRPGMIEVSKKLCEIYRAV